MRRSVPRPEPPAAPPARCKCWDGSACGSGWPRWSGAWGRPRWSWRSSPHWGWPSTSSAALPQPVRWAIWGIWLAAGGFVLVVTTLRPLLKRFGTFDLAAAAEQGHPELGESLTGAVALLGSRRPHGSPELIAALADRAARSCRTLRPRPASWSRAGRRLALGLLAVGLVAAPPLLRPDPFGVLARRFLMPWADIDRVARIVLSVAPGDKVIAAGSDLTYHRRSPALARHPAGPGPRLRLARMGRRGRAVACSGSPCRPVATAGSPKSVARAVGSR